MDIYVSWVCRSIGLSVVPLRNQVMGEESSRKGLAGGIETADTRSLVGTSVRRQVLDINLSTRLMQYQNICNTTYGAQPTSSQVRPLHFPPGPCPCWSVIKNEESLYGHTLRSHATAPAGKTVVCPTEHASGSYPHVRAQGLSYSGLFPR